MSQEPPPLAQRIIESDSDDEDPATELDAAGDTRRIIQGGIQPAYPRRTGIQWRWEEHHKLAQTKERLEQGVNPNTLDEKFRMAWKTF